MPTYSKTISASLAQAIFTQLPSAAKVPTPGTIMASFKPNVKDQTTGTIIVDSQYQATLDAILAMPNLAAAQLSSYTATLRYNLQIGGVTIDGMTILTDTDSQNLLNGAVNLVTLDKTVTEIDFKGPNGFMILSAAQIVTIGKAVGGFVQRCFSAEKAIGAKIASGVYTQDSDIDYAVEWPITNITTS